MASEAQFAKGTMFGMDTYDDEIVSLAREAIRVYGDAAAEVVTEMADQLFLEGSLEEAFICRLVVSAIEELS
jgi:hypothetical protein